MLEAPPVVTNSIFSRNGGLTTSADVVAKTKAKAKVAIPAAAAEVPVIKREEWKTTSSASAKNCRNYIREIVDNLHLEPNPDKPVIALSIGDPTVYGNLPPSPSTTSAVLSTLTASLHNGYAPSTGYLASRTAISTHLNLSNGSLTSYTAPDILICSGCSSALDLAITVLADPHRHQHILMPRPGFPLYRTLAEGLGVGVVLYDLVPEREWEVDLDDLERKVNDQTAAIVVNNPSNPCGSVYGAEHLLELLKIAQRHQIPIIADEIYEHLVFPEHQFTSMAVLSRHVPILTCGGLAKRYLVPGWRVGWIAIHDPIGAFTAEVRPGLQALSQRTIGSNTLIQGAIPGILETTPVSFHQELIAMLQDNAKAAYNALREVKGLEPFMPQGAMYMMVRLHRDHFPEFRDGLAFVSRLMEEESVFPLPGEAFFLPGFVRIVLTVPKDLLLEACQRMADFSHRYYVE